MSANFHGQAVALFGLGISGKATIDALLRDGVEVYAWDDNESSRQALSKHPNLHICSYNEMPWKQCRALLLSPGVPLYFPIQHPVVLAARAENCPIICDVEWLYRTSPNAHYIGITGTNGKSTTTALIYHLLQSATKNIAIGGNIGVPVLSLPQFSRDGKYVLELSSYQLDLLEEMRINTAVWLNITPDHLDRHGSLSGYIAAKERIFRHQDSHDNVVIGVDDLESQAVYEKLLQNNLARVIPISCRAEKAKGVYVSDKEIIDSMNGETKFYPRPAPVHLAGKHNAQNLAAAYAVARLNGMSAENIIAQMESFIGLPHRMQFVAEINGVRFINDSKATNADATEKALQTFTNIYWIVGGKPKSDGIAPLSPLFPRVKKSYLVGEASAEFAKTLEGKIPYQYCQTIENAILQAAADAFAAKSSERPVVLLSPACASFDQWKNFEARGEAFFGYVRDLAKKR
jgi:UDP-N-acetylmuramoylalanine--D-glutamate ligase